MKLRSLVAVVTVALSGACFAQFNAKDMVLSGDKAFGLLPPDSIGSGFREIAWSGSGQYISGVRADVPSAKLISEYMRGASKVAPPLSQVVVYSLAKRQSVIVWNCRPNQRIGDTVWAGKSDQLLVMIEETSRTVEVDQPNPGLVKVIVFDAEKGTTTELWQAPTRNGEPSFGLYASPVLPAAVLLEVSNVRATAPSVAQAAPEVVPVKYSLLLLDKQTVTPLRLPPGAYVRGWSPDGTKVVTYEHARLPGGTVIQKWNDLDPITGETKSTAAMSLYDSSRLHKELLLSNGTSTSKSGSAERKLQSFWIESVSDPENRSLVAGEADVAELAPALTGVAYITQGVAMVRPLMSLPRKAYEEALKAAEKTLAMSNGKQAATALMMYAADNDDNVPKKGEDINSILDPYLKNPSILQNFVYTFEGGNLAKIEEPANTEIGYVTGPGGKAIVYADGHVKWRDDK